MPGSWPARSIRFAAPTAAVAMAGAAAAGLVEGALQGAAFESILCAAGAAALYAAPLLLVLGLAARGLWRGWRPAMAAMERAPGDVDAASLLAGAVYASVAVAALGAAGYGAALLAVDARGPSVRVSGPVVAAGLAVVAAALLAVSRPAVLGLARAARAVGLRRPRACLLALAALAAILAAAIWFGVVGPALAKVNYGYAGYGWTALLSLPVGHAVARRLGRARWVAGGAAAAVCLALIGGSVATRLRDPAVLFDAWFRMPVGGLAIGATYDIDDLRSEAVPADPTPRPRPGATHPDILLVTIDTLRADQLRLYGGAAGMPNIEQLAQGGVVFDWAFAPSNNTRQSVSSMMTGLSPARLRGRVAEFGLRLDPRHILVAERFRAAGYATAGFLCCANHMGGRKKIGLDRGLESVAFQRNGDLLKDLAAEWLRASAGEARRRFVWVHFFDPHDWRRSPGRGHRGAEARARYRQAIQRTDRFLAPILGAVRDSGRPTIVVIGSDHGEGLGDHRAVHHASDLYNSQIRVPLVIAGPGIAPRRVGEPVALLDLAPTLLDLAGFEPPGMPAMDARSIAGLVRGGESASEAYAVMVRDRSVERTGHALIAGRHKLIVVDGRRPELYDVVGDPAEARNLASRQPRLLEDLTARLRRRQAVDEVDPF